MSSRINGNVSVRLIVAAAPRQMEKSFKLLLLKNGKKIGI